MLTYRKTAQEIEALSINSFQNTPIGIPAEGSIILGIVRSVAAMIEQFYSDLEDNIDITSFTKSEQGFVDAIGKLVNCEREPGETDENYKYRISNQVYVVAGGNRIGITVEVQKIAGIKEVTFIPYKLGTGSFVAYVVPQDYLYAETAVNAVQEVLNSMASFGIRAMAVTPKFSLVGIEGNLIFVDGARDAAIAAQAATNIKAYVDNLGVGEPLIASSLYQIIRDTSTNIVDVVINKIVVNGKPLIVSNFRPAQSEKLYVESTDDIII